MYNNYCHHLRFDFTIDNSNILKAKESYKDLDKQMVFAFPLETADVTFAKFLETLGLKMGHCEALYTPPHGELMLHTDTWVPSNNVKINWVYDAEGSLVEWWIPKDPQKKLDLQLNPSGYKLIKYSKEECIKVWSDVSILDTAVMINSGIPHCVVNPSDKARWCYSHEIVDIKTGKILQWYDATQIFKPWIL